MVYLRRSVSIELRIRKDCGTLRGSCNNHIAGQQGWSDLARSQEKREVPRDQSANNSNWGAAAVTMVRPLPPRQHPPVRLNVRHAPHPFDGAVSLL